MKQTKYFNILMEESKDMYLKNVTAEEAGEELGRSPGYIEKAAYEGLVVKGKYIIERVVQDGKIDTQEAWRKEFKEEWEKMRRMFISKQYRTTFTENDDLTFYEYETGKHIIVDILKKYQKKG